MQPFLPHEHGEVLRKCCLQYWTVHYYRNWMVYIVWRFLDHNYSILHVALTHDTLIPYCYYLWALDLVMLLLLCFQCLLNLAATKLMTSSSQLQCHDEEL